MVKRPDVLVVLHILQIQAPCFCVPHPLVSSTPLLMAPVTDSSPGRRPDFDSSNDQREDASSRISPRRQICPCPSLNHFPHNPPTYFPLSGCQPLNGSSASISAPRALTSYGFVSVEDDRLREKQRQLIATKITTKFSHNSLGRQNPLFADEGPLKTGEEEGRWIFRAF